MFFASEIQLKSDSGFHRHGVHEWLLCRGTGGEQHVDGNVIPFSPGRLIFLPGGTHHGLVYKGEVIEGAYFCFEPNLFLQYNLPDMQQALEGLISSRIYIQREDPEVYAENIRRVNEIMSVISSGDPFASSHLLFLIGELVLHFRRHIPVELTGVETKNGNIAQLCVGITEAPAAPLSLDEAAESVFMSRAAFCRKFKAFTGETFTEYVKSARIRLAVKLLAESDDAVQKISLRSGFNNLPHFHDTFLKMTGATPHALRLKLRKTGLDPRSVCLRLNRKNS